MLAKCANPACTAPFLYLREGKLYQIEMEGGSGRGTGEQNQGTIKDERKPARRL